MATFAEALARKTKLSSALLQRPDVRGIGVGYANPDKPEWGAAVIVYTGKASTTEATGQMVTTTSTENFPIRYISSGVFKPSVSPPNLKGEADWFRRRMRPVPAGTSIGVPTHGTGTAGLIVTKNKRLYLLTNNHILNRKYSTARGETIQPGRADGGQSGNDRIGRAYQYIPFKPNGVNYMDAAIAKPVSNAVLTPKYLANSGRLLVVPGHLKQFRVGERFVKSGRTTGSIMGVVEAVNVDIRIRYGSLGKLLFRNQAVIVGRTGAGDSGSVWLRQRDRYAGALHFAGDGIRSISTPIGNVLSVFGLRVAVASKAGGFKAGSVKKASRFANAAFTTPLTAEQRKKCRTVLVRE